MVGVLVLRWTEIKNNVNEYQYIRINQLKCVLLSARIMFQQTAFLAETEGKIFCLHFHTKLCKSCVKGQLTSTKI